MQKQKSSLRRELSFIEAIALSIGIMAPTAAMALNGSLAAGITGSAVPLAFLLATIAVGLASFSFIQFSRYFAHSGSVYGFNGMALGPRSQKVPPQASAVRVKEVLTEVRANIARERRVTFRMRRH